MIQYLTLEEVLELHFMLIEDYGGSHGVRDEARLLSLIEAPQLTVFNVKQYPTVYEKAAVNMRNCIADHIFTDGNKRTAVTIASIFLMRNNYELAASPESLEDFTVEVATMHYDIEYIAQWLSKHTKEEV